MVTVTRGSSHVTAGDTMDSWTTLCQTLGRNTLKMLDDTVPKLGQEYIENCWTTLCQTLGRNTLKIFVAWLG